MYISLEQERIENFFSFLLNASITLENSDSFINTIRFFNQMATYDDMSYANGTVTSLLQIDNPFMTT